jgi:hypothetical protein
LLPGQLTPLLPDQLAHLGTWMPFAHAAQMLSRFTQVAVRESSAQRLTETIGMAYEAVQLAEVERIECDWPEAPPGPDKLVLSVDGAFVPLLHGDWDEVKTLVVGEVAAPTIVDGKTMLSTHRHSSFSRLAEAELFQRLTFGERYRRRVETAGQIATGRDGAEGIQGFIAFHCPDATRILDFPHAAQRICQIGEAVLGPAHAGLSAWQTRQLHTLKHPEEEASRLTTDEAIDLIFRPNFSTAAQITEVLGLGVGMDVVRANVERLSGSVLVESITGCGTTFRITLPLTLAIVPAMLIRLERRSSIIFRRCFVGVAGQKKSGK